MTPVRVYVGHFYIALDNIDAWAAFTDPLVWNQTRAVKLKALFEVRPTPW